LRSHLSGSDWILRGLGETHFNIASGLIFLKNYEESVKFLEHAESFVRQVIIQLREIIISQTSKCLESKKEDDSLEIAVLEY
jgi:hypothetical protein